MSLCRYCHATVKWVILDTGKSIPVEPTARHDRGSIAAAPRGGRLVGHVITATKPLGNSELRYVIHRVACKPEKPRVTAAERAPTLLDL